MSEIRGLSLLQPWATLIAIGAKQFETRSWWTPYRGRIAIHASKKYTKWQKELAEEDYFIDALVHESIPTGVIIATANLEEVRMTEDVVGAYLIDKHEIAFGDWTVGRYAWKVSEVARLTDPIPCKGALGLWRVPDEIAEVLE